MKKTINELTRKLGDNLKEKKLSLVTVESCTGGGLTYYISLNPASSSSLERGFITYSNQSKEELLNVKPESLQTHGAVSKEVAIEMAEGALKNSSAQISVAITGIAAPDKSGKSNQKGSAWIACASVLTKTTVEKKIISGTRHQFCEQLIIASLEVLIKYLNKLKI